MTRRPAVRKKVEVVETILGPSAKGTAPTVAARGPLDPELIELLPPLNEAVRQRLVDALADIALGEIDGGSIPDVAKD